MAVALPAFICLGGLASSTQAIEVTYQPYIQPGDASGLASSDQMVIAWQTDDKTPTPNLYRVAFGQNGKLDQEATIKGRVVDNYLAADPSLPQPPSAPGPRINYYAVLSGLNYSSTYSYRVTGPGLPGEGFASTFGTRATTSNRFSFQVMGDEGFFPTDPVNPPYLADFEARVVHTMFNADKLTLPYGVKLPRPNLALNTGDNVYNVGSEGNYRDFWMPVWNSNVDSNETGAPYVRSIPYYIVAGNHDTGGNGDFVNLLASDSAARYSGNLEGGDALQYFNNFYFPLNGPRGADAQYVFNGDTRTDNGFYLSYLGQTYTSPAAIEAFRASTRVDTGDGSKRQIDRMANYSFDYGNTHFVFLDANPHLFNALVDYTAIYLAAPSSFPDYPTILRNWLINDLDGSDQPWKVAVFHQPSFSSGNGTLRNNQMRQVVRFLQDHGVNFVFNGHEHNYQRTLPLRALKGVDETPSTDHPPVVALDTNFDGTRNTVPDGVIYFVEGAGGDRDFDNNLLPPRGLGFNADQDDSASGFYTYEPGETYPIGPRSWLDTHLTNVQMRNFVPNAGEGPKITARFKAKVFSFGQALVDGNDFTFYQISEPLLATSSATDDNPTPYGTDVHGRAINDPIPDTLVDPVTGEVVTPPAEGPSAVLDAIKVTRPDLRGQVEATLTRPEGSRAGGELFYEGSVRNGSKYALNGAQAVVTLPEGVTFTGLLSDRVTRQGNAVVITLGRLAPGASATFNLKARTDSGNSGEAVAQVYLRTSTAQTNNNKAALSIDGALK